jgi:hypothetical protein
MPLTRKHPFDKEQLEIVFSQLIEAVNQFIAMGDEDKNTPQYADALSEFSELSRQLDTVAARFG